MGNSSIYGTIEEVLKAQGRILLQTTGISMEPLLHDRKSTVVIEQAAGELKKYDVALFSRPSGEYVLHRIVKVRDKDYLICGDNGLYKEPVLKENVLGVMTGFYPDEGEKFVSCEDEEYRRYLRTLGVRYGARRIKAALRRIRRKFYILLRGG